MFLSGNTSHIFGPCQTGLYKYRHLNHRWKCVINICRNIAWSLRVHQVLPGITLSHKMDCKSIFRTVRWECAYICEANKVFQIPLRKVVCIFYPVSQRCFFLSHWSDRSMLWKRYVQELLQSIQTILSNSKLLSRKLSHFDLNLIAWTENVVFCFFKNLLRTWVFDKLPEKEITYSWWHLQRVKSCKKNSC